MARELAPSSNDGMRSLRREEFSSLQTLLDTVFRPGLAAEYPHIYAAEHAPFLRVVVRDCEVVSHMAALRRYASLFGCTVRVASLGGVATYEKHRGKGYATALFEDSMRACREDGVDFMHVSGYRNMYHRFGCRYVGRHWKFTVTAAQAELFDDAAVSLTETTRKDTTAMAAAYRREPVRWLRPPSDFVNTLEGFVMNRPTRVLTLREGKAFRGYVVIAQPPQEQGATTAMLEYAGDRKAIAGALGQLVRQYDLETLDLHVADHDRLLLDLMRERGVEGTPAATSGTVTLIHFEQLMERMRPHFSELVGEDAATGLVFQQLEDHFRFSYGGDSVVADDPGQAVQLIFGTPGREEESLLQNGGRAAEILREILPIPTLWYGVNYV